MKLQFRSLCIASVKSQKQHHVLYMNLCEFHKFESQPKQRTFLIWLESTFARHLQASEGSFKVSVLYNRKFRSRNNSPCPVSLMAFWLSVKVGLLLFALDSRATVDLRTSLRKLFA